MPTTSTQRRNTVGGRSRLRDPGHPTFSGCGRSGWGGLCYPTRPKGVWEITGTSVLVLVALLLGGCATHYAPFDCTPTGDPWPFPGWNCKGGHSEVRLAPQMYQVRFEGGATRAQTEDLALLRCAELTLEKGYPYFIVLEAVDSGETRVEDSPRTYNPPTTVCDKKGKNCVTSPGTWSGGGSRTISLHAYSLTIELLRERPALEHQILYDATSVQHDLRRKYGLSRASD